MGVAMKKTIVSLLAISAVFLFANRSSAQVFQSTLNPANDTPPLDTGMGGLAVSVVTVNDDGSSTALIVAAAFGNATPIVGSHVHIGDAGVAGPIICPTSGPEFQNPLIATCNFTPD